MMNTFQVEVYSSMFLRSHHQVSGALLTVAIYIIRIYKIMKVLYLSRNSAT